MKRDTVSAYRARNKVMDDHVSAAAVAVAAARAAAFKAAVAETNAKEAARVRLTRDDIIGATHVRTAYAWHKVARVNKTTVSVETGYSWVDRIPFDKILDARTIEPKA
jgi:hypothetical protein